MASAEWRYLCAGLVTGTILGEIPQLVGADFGYVLNAAGQFSAHMPPDVPALGPGRDLLTLTKPGRTALYALREGKPMWGGIIWTRHWNPDTQLFDLAGADFWSYYQSRKQSTTKKFVNVDQLALVQILLNAAHGAASGHPGNVVVGTETSGVNRTHSIQGYQRKSIAAEIERGSQEDNGYDFGIDTDLDGSGNLRNTFHLHYPRRGLDLTTSPLVFEYPGNIRTYTYSEDATPTANTVHAHGAGGGKAMTTSTASGAIPDPEIPMLEAIFAHKDVGEQGNLDDHANAMLKSLNQVQEFPVLTVRAGVDPVVGTYSTGYDARVRITDPVRFPTPLDAWYRITAIKMKPPEAGVRDEEVELTLGPLWS